MAEMETGISNTPAVGALEKMEQTFLERQRAQESNLNVLPRNFYFQTVEEVKIASEKTSGRVRREFYLLKK